MLTPSQMEHYRESGYAVASGLFDVEQPNATR